MSNCGNERHQEKVIRIENLLWIDMDWIGYKVGTKSW
jgi:hypothetical protein